MTTIALNLDERSSSRPLRVPRQRNLGDRVFFGALTLAALAVPALLVLFVSVLVFGAWPAIREFGFTFITSAEWKTDPDVGEMYGARPFILGTLITSALALALAAPLGIGVAAFLNEILPARLRSTFRFMIETLATIPSVVYGLWGVDVMAPWIRRVLQPALAHTLGEVPVIGQLFSGEGQQRNLLCAVLILTIMILPLILSMSLDAMRMVPASFREAALGLGATRWEMIRMAVLPAARSGIAGGCILALGRALGETMAVTMVIGNSRLLQASVFAPANTISSIIATQFAESPTELLTAALIEMALLLFVVTLTVNLLARMVLRRLARNLGGGK